MSTIYTTNYNLKKPGPDDFVDINELNDNADFIDTQMKLAQDHRDAANPHSGTAEKHHTHTISDIAELGISLANKADGLTAAKTIYVATTGSNSTGNGTQAKPFATVNKALSTVPKNLNGYNAIINIAAGSYGEIITVSCFCNGGIDLNFAEGCTFWGLKVFSSSALTRIGGSPSFVYNANGAYIIDNGKKAIVYMENSALRFKSGGISVTGTSDCSGIVVATKGNYSSYSSAFVIKVSGCYYGILVGGSLAHFPTLQTNTANTIGIHCAGGGICAYASIQAGFGKTQYATTGGGRIHAGAQTNVPNY